MTIHKAKGLEFLAVFVIGLVEGITPTKRGDIETERRIVFVGILREMKVLYLSDPRQMFLRGRRLVWDSETEELSHFAVGKIKWLMGADTLTGRPP